VHHGFCTISIADDALFDLCDQICVVESCDEEVSVDPANRCK